jgi:Fungal specific transcription factor domain
MTSALPGGRDLDADGGRGSVLLEVHFPPRPVAGALIDSYFDTVHWFMFIIHEPSFRQRADRILSLGSQMMTTSDADFAALLLMVIALGAQYAGKNPHWKSTSLTKDYSIDLTALVPQLIGQVRSHLLDMLEHCQIEAVQTCVLLGTFYIYHGNPNLSWSVLGLAVKAAYALGMHREVDWKGDSILLQVRKRAWGHTYIADTFAAVIYGRPSTVDRNFCDVSHPDECDDTAISMPLHGFLESVNDGKSISKLSYHTHKYVLYDIKAQIISKIYTVRARASFQASCGGSQKLVQVVQSFDRKLKAWHDQLPSFFTRTKWTTGEENPEDVLETLHERLPESQELIKEQLIMQSVALQVLHDYILILLHRPLLEYRISSQNRERRQTLTNDPFPNSFETCVEAALRISHAPAHKFKYHCPMALITMHMFTAGVILCLPATMDPFSALAHKTKGAVVRMIRGFKKLSAQTPVVSQSCTILEELMKVVLSRELELILSPEDQDDVHHDNPESRFGVSEIRPIRQASNDFPNSEHESTRHVPASRISLAPPHSVNSPRNRGTNMPQQTNTTSLDYNASSKTGFSSESFPEAFVANSNSTVSPEAFQASQSYDFIDAEPDVGFNDAFGALEKGKLVSETAISTGH